MKTIIEINNRQTFIIAEKDVPKLMEILSRAVLVEWDYKNYQSGQPYEYFVDGAPDVSMKKVPDRCFKPRPGEADITGPIEINGASPQGKKILRLPAQTPAQKLLGM